LTKPTAKEVKAICFPVKGGLGEWPQLTGVCARWDRCENHGYINGQQSVEIKLAHNRTMMKWWFAAECCPKHPQPKHNTGIPRHWWELLKGMAWKADIFFIMTSKPGGPPLSIWDDVDLAIKAATTSASQNYVEREAGE